MGGFSPDMFASSAQRIGCRTPDDLCVDSFRDGELLVSALLEVTERNLRKPGSLHPLLCGWKTNDVRSEIPEDEICDRYTCSNRRRNGTNFQPISDSIIAESKFQHHLDPSGYIEDYRRNHAQVHQEPTETRPVLSLEQPKIIGDRSHDREKENLQKEMNYIHLISSQTKNQVPTFEEFSNTIHALTDCYQVHRLTPGFEIGVKGYEEPRTTPVCPSPVNHFPDENSLDGLHFNCITGKPALSNRSSSDSQCSSSSKRNLKKEKQKTRSPPHVESKSIEEQVERRHLVLPRITQDLCASFRQETQIEDVKRLKDYKRHRQLNSRERADEAVVSSGLKMRHDLLESVRPEALLSGTSRDFRDHYSRGLTSNDFRDLKSQRIPSDKKESVAEIPLVIPWTGASLHRRPFTRRKKQTTICPKENT